MSAVEHLPQTPSSDTLARRILHGGTDHVGVTVESTQ
jgi:hypothetical protein